MEFVPQLLISLLSLKNKYDQHGVNKKEIARLQKFIGDYEERIPQLLVGFKQHGVSGTSMDDLKKLRVVIMEATKKLNGWAADKRFFRVLSSAQRMQELDSLEVQVMAATEKAVGFITLAMVMQLNGGQKELLAGVHQILERLPESSSRPARAQPAEEPTTDQVLEARPFQPHLVYISTGKRIKQKHLSYDRSLKVDINKELTEAFKVFDRNGDGKISREDLGTVLRSLGEAPTEADLDQMIKDVDANGDGEIDLQEFINLNNIDSKRGTSATWNAAEEEGYEALQSAFDVFDMDKDGFISPVELHRVMFGLGDDRVSLDDCQYMISCVDADGDQKVNFKEFQTLMTGHTYSPTAESSIYSRL